MPQRNGTVPWEESDSLAAYFRKIGEFPVLPPEETIRLCRKFRKTKDRVVWEKIITHNLRFVVAVAKGYIGRGLSFLEIIQEGNIGLMKAVERFKPSKGCRLTTYARWWIRQSIARAIANHSQTIRLPIHVIDRRRKVSHIAEGLAERFGRPPTEVELSQATEEPIEFITQCFNPVFAVSLDTPLLSDDTGTLGDLIPDEKAVSPSEGVEYETRAVCIEEALRTLTGKEQVILRHRFGFLDGGRQFTLEEVGKIFKVTRERIRQIEAKALRKLRSPRRLKLLKTELT